MTEDSRTKAGLGITPCQCPFCQKDYPEYLLMRKETDIEKVRKYAERMFDNWQMEEAEHDFTKFLRDKNE